MKIPKLVPLCMVGKLVSDPFLIESQITIVALGLQTGDTVDFWIDLVSDPVNAPGGVVLPTILQSTLLQTNGCSVQLTPANNWIVLDAPQGFLLHAQLHIAGPATIQRVMMNENTTAFLATAN